MDDPIQSGQATPTNTPEKKMTILQGNPASEQPLPIYEQSIAQVEPLKPTLPKELRDLLGQPVLGYEQDGMTNSVSAHLETQQYHEREEDRQQREAEQLARVRTELQQITTDQSLLGDSAPETDPVRTTELPVSAPIALSTSNSEENRVMPWVKRVAKLFRRQSSEEINQMWYYRKQRLRSHLQPSS